MTEPPERDRGFEPGASLSADRTRDIRMRPLPRPAAAATDPMPGWEPPPSADPDRPGEGSSIGSVADQPTDELNAPPQGARNQTLTFEGTAAERWAAGLAATPDPPWSAVPPASRPVVGARPRPAPGGRRRWPWIVLALLPVLIIAGTGVWLLLLLRAG
jgi:hypothetical protein